MKKFRILLFILIIFLVLGLALAKNLNAGEAFSSLKILPADSQICLSDHTLAMIRLEASASNNDLPEGFQPISSKMRGAVKIKRSFLYEQPDKKSQKISGLAFGTKVRTRRVRDSWYYVSVRIGGKVRKGFMSASGLVLYNKNKKHLALTFDDGPKKASTGIVLNALSKYKCKATFFHLGSLINKDTKSLLKREAKLGCETGNHSFSHAQLSGLSKEAIRSELDQTDALIAQYTGRKSGLYRTPYGEQDSGILSVLKGPNILWSVDTLDWKYRDTARLIDVVRNSAKDGSIILMHDIHETTAKAVARICKNLKKDGYEAVTVTELAAIRGVKMQAGQCYTAF